MTTTNSWDLVAGFNQDYLSALGLYLYDSGKFPHTYQSTIYDLTLDPPALSISGTAPNTLAFKIDFQGTQSGKPIEGFLNMAVDVSKVAIDYVNQQSYLQMNGNSSEYADCGNPGTITSKGCTLEGWINTSVGSAQNLLVFGQATPGLSLSNNRLSLQWDGLNMSADAANISDGKWHHVAVVVADNKITFYKDGQAKDTVTLFGGAVQSSAGDLRLGYEVGSNASFSGSMTQVRVWNVPLTAQQIQQAMNANLSGDEAGLIGYWTFTNDQVLNQANGQQGSVNGGATVVEQTEETEVSYTPYLLFWDPPNTFVVTSNVTTGTTTGDNAALDRSVTASLQAFASSAHIMPSKGAASTIMPTTINFITRTSASDPVLNQMLGLIMTQNRLQPSEDPSQAFADDPQVLIPSGSNAVVALWDYIFLEYIVAPALAKVLHVKSAQMVVTEGDPSELNLDGEGTIETKGKLKTEIKVTRLKTYVDHQGLFLGLQGNACNELIFVSLQATLNMVVNNAESAPEQSASEQSAPEQSAPGRVLFSFNNSSADSSGEKIVLTAWNPYARTSSSKTLTDTSSESLTLTLKDVSVQVLWNQANPNVQSCEALLEGMPIMGPCFTSCCQGIVQLIQDKAVSTANAFNKNVTLDKFAAFDLNQIVFDDGFILFGTATPGASSSA